MVNPLLEFAKSYVAGKMDAWVFSEAYGWIFKIVSGSNLYPDERGVIGEHLACIFTTADCYTPFELHYGIDLNDEMLLVYVKTELERLESRY